MLPKVVNGEPLPRESTRVILDVASGQSRVLAELGKQVGRILFFRRSLAWTPDSQTVLVAKGKPLDPDPTGKRGPEPWRPFITAGRSKSRDWALFFAMRTARVPERYTKGTEAVFRGRRES